MRSSQQQPKRVRRDLLIEGSKVAFSPARSLTSHARRIYHAKYAGRYRFAVLVFAFDAFLVGLAVSLCLATLIFVSVVPAHLDGGLGLSVRAPALRGSDSTPFAVKVRSIDGKRHEHVRLHLQLPAWAEVMRSEPRSAADGSIDLGTISPSVPANILLVLRSRQANIDLPFTWSLHQDDWTGFVADVDAKETRHVGASVISVTSDPAVTTVSVGGAIPFLVRNGGSAAIPEVIFRVREVEGGAASIGGRDAFELGSIDPGQTYRVFVDVASLKSETLRIDWQVQDGAQVGIAGSDSFEVGATQATTTDVRFPDQTFPLTAQVRYYSASGDQIGVGPLPPKVGERTSYWAALSLGPTFGAMKGLHVHVDLPPGVTATGRTATALNATSKVESNSVDWMADDVPSIGAQGVPLTFEISFRPNANQAGQVADLLLPATAEARSAASGERLTSRSAAVTTDLVTDAKASGKGIIQP